MAAPTISTVGYNPNDPTASKSYMQQMLAAQLRQQIAEQQMADGGQPDPNGFIPGNSLAPGRAVAVSPVANLAKSLEKITGAYGQKAAMQKQVDLQTAMMQRQYGMLNDVIGGGNGAASADGATAPQTAGQAALKRAYLAKVMGAPDEVVKGMIDYAAPTPDQKNAGSVGMNPLQYQGAQAVNTAKAGAGVKVAPITMPDGTTKMMTDLQQADMANGGTAQASLVPPALPAQAAAPASGALAPMPGFKDTTAPSILVNQLPPALQQSIAANPNMPPALPSGAVPASPPASQVPGFAVQGPSAKEGLTKEYQNFADYKNGLDKTVAESGDALRIINAQEDFAKNFSPGAGQTTLAHLASVAKSMGGTDNLAAMISKGDPGSVEAFEALASQHAMRQAEMLMAGGGGSGGQRISQSVFESFKNDLSSPDKRPNAIAAINALSRQQYQDSLGEQQALNAYKGDPLKFRSEYAAKRNGTLMEGRSADPQQAINQGKIGSAPMAAPPPVAQRQVGMVVNSPQGPVKWTGTGWMRVQNAQP